MADQKTRDRGAEMLRLHRDPALLTLVNVWDVISARVVGGVEGARALATASPSLAASSGRDAPRGLEFLLLRNRINVAISRAKHTAYIVYAPGLLDDFPRTPDGIARLSGFARLVNEAGRG